MSIKLEREVKKFVTPYNTKKGIKWKVCIPDGRSGQERARGFRTLAEAQIFAKEKFTKILLTKDRSSFMSSKITFNDYSQLWLQSKERNGLVVETLRRYSDQVQHFINPFFGNFKLMELEKYHLRNFIESLQEKNTTSYNVHSAVTIFKMIVREAIEQDYMPLTNILTVKTPRHKAKVPRFWDYNEMLFFLNATKECKHYDLWKLVLYTGLRAGEVAALQWDCIHFGMKSGDHVGFIEVKRTCAQKSKRISERTKNGDRRLVPILPQIKDLLLELKSKSFGPFVFGDLEPLETSHLNRTLKVQLGKIREIKPINFHGLRHTFCSYLDSTGMSRRIVSEIMGHRDLNTTNRYSHVSNQTIGLEVTKWFEKQNQQQSSKVSLVAL